MFKQKHCYQLNLLYLHPPTFRPVDAGCVYASYIHDAGLAVVY
jgi:hypothetical protein